MVIFRELSSFLTVLVPRKASALSSSHLDGELYVRVQAVQVISQCLTLPSTQLGVGVIHIVGPPMQGFRAVGIASSSKSSICMSHAIMETGDPMADP